MVFLVLLIGPLLVRLLASIMEYRSRPVRAILPTVCAVLVGLLASSLSAEMFISDNIGSLMSLIDTIFCIPAIWGVGASITMVTLGYSGEGSFWSEYFRVGNVSYGTWDVGLGLWGDILYGTVFAGGTILICSLFMYNAIPYIYFGVQALVCLKALLTKD